MPYVSDEILINNRLCLRGTITFLMKFMWNFSAGKHFTENEHAVEYVCRVYVAYNFLCLLVLPICSRRMHALVPWLVKQKYFESFNMLYNTLIFTHPHIRSTDDWSEQMKNRFFFSLSFYMSFISYENKIAVWQIVAHIKLYECMECIFIFRFVPAIMILGACTVSCCHKQDSDSSVCGDRFDILRMEITMTVRLLTKNRFDEKANKTIIVKRIIVYSEQWHTE